MLRTGEPIEGEVFDASGRLSYVAGDLADDATYGRVAEAIKGAKSPVFYLEVPPSLFGMLINVLAGAGLAENARMVVEKPFGHDLGSARELAAEPPPGGRPVGSSRGRAVGARGVLVDAQEVQVVGGDLRRSLFAGQRAGQEPG
jgi:hypothetical protein